MSAQKILIVEDENDIAEIIKLNLETDGYQTKLVSRGDQVLSELKIFQPDLILLDLMLPGAHGLEVCQHVRENKENDNIAIIILSALGSEEDIVKGLELGADDYLTKPFSPNILKARVKSVLRRFATNGDKKSEVNEISHFNMKMNREKFFVKVNSVEVKFTPSEFEILWLLLASPGVVFTRAQIVNLIRGSNHAITDRAVDFQMVGVRKKLGEQGQHIETVRGVGYRVLEEN